MVKSIEEDELFTIREEKIGDEPAIRGLNESAFPEPTEAAIVDKLRTHCSQTVSLVAIDQDRVVGHLLFSPATVGSLSGMGLAPMAVLPEFQRRGFGSALVRFGIDFLKERGVPFIVVLGHPQFYRKFGFVPASLHSLQCQWPGIPDEAFMVLLLDPEKMRDCEGTIFYRDEFNTAI